MLLVIFGAGATYDSDRRRAGAADEERPPLTKDLFAPRFASIVARYPAVQGIIPQLRESRNVEQALEDLQAEQGRRPHRARQLMAATYYLRDVVADAQEEWMKGRADRITNYTELIERTEVWRHDNGERAVALVTFNYDTLLESAVHNIIGQRFMSVDNYIDNPTPYSIFKLHGSINWWTGVAHRDRASAMPLRDWAERILATSSKPDPLGTYLVADIDSQSSEAMVPALAMPIVTKTNQDFACPQGHLEALTSFLPHADRVLVIGWRGVEAHFYALWKESYRPGQMPPKKLLLVDKGEATNHAWDNLKAGAHWLPPPTTFGGGFSALIGSPELAEFLS